MNDLDLARAAVATALQMGCSGADAALSASTSRQVHVRDGEVERVLEAQSRAIGVRAFRGQRVGYAYANHVTVEAVREAARQASELAHVAAEDDAVGLPDAAELGQFEGDLDLVDASIPEQPVDAWRDLALKAEAASREDERITLSEGARAAGAHSTVSLVNHLGFAGQLARTSCSVRASVFATGEQGERQRAGWYDAQTNLAALASPESIGREAARRALRGVGWKRAPSGPVPVVFPPEISCDLAGTIASAVSAALVYRGGTFLADSLGQRIASDVVTLMDDSTLARRLGSRPFDGEGVRGRRTPVVVAGELQSWLADSYSARRTSSSTTGNAARSLSGPPSVGSSNLVLSGGTRTPEALIGDVERGLFVTSLFGFGVNLATGAWSRGGSGIWIENGEFAYPVQELTIAGDLPTLLTGVREAANDLTWHGGCGAPTLLVEGLTVAGG